MYSMYLYTFFLQTFIVVACAQISQIIRDYFVYKNVTRVAGFSCGNMDEDLLTLKLLNNAGISTAIKPAGLQIDILRYLNTDRIMGVFVDIRCPNQNFSGIFDEGSGHRMYDYSYTWLIFGSNLNHSLQSLNDTGFSIVTDFAIILPNETEYVLYDVYNLCKIRGGVLNVTWLGSWREDDGLTINLTDPRVNRRRNYNRLQIKAVGIVLHRPEYLSLIDYLERDNLEIMDNWPKFGYTMLSHVANMYNFTMDLIEITHWNKSDRNGPVMGALKRDVADLAYYPSILTVERYADARVILPQWPTRTCFMFRTIPAMKMKPWIILKPFAADTWYMIVVIVVITIFILSCILKLERAEDYSCSISALITVAALCQQGFPTLTDQSASRIAFIQILIFGLLVYNYYSAAIVSARLNEPLQKMNDSLYSLAHSKMQMAAEENIFFDFLLRKKTPEVQYFNYFWNLIPESKRFISLEDGVQEIKKGGFAYHADPDDIYPMIEREFDKQMICQLTEVHLLQPSELGLWSTHKSHLHEISKRAFLKISTSGIRRREIRRWTARKPYCPDDEIFVSSVTIYEAAPILILLLFGMIISFIVFGIEHFIFYTMNSKRVSGTTSDTRVGIKRNSKLTMKQSIKPDVNKSIKVDKKNKLNKIMLKNPPKNNVILALPEASRLFEQVLMSKRYQ
ncbi:ionotropic receptor 75a [Monomorium pharaonis]|uniref:ionotropic receptor 75a n=1 Tax=Monomorium pharaonis TaxID=307658 RepID=UPI00102E11EC|nr:ionotropic receptor 75a [Monomorium pharaonis]